MPGALVEADFWIGYLRKVNIWGTSACRFRVVQHGRVETAMDVLWLSLDLGGSSPGWRQNSLFGRALGQERIAVFLQTMIRVLMQS